MTNQEIKTVGQTIAAETQIGGNTAERVGGVIEGIGDALDNKDAAVGYYLATMSGSTIYINASSYRLGTGGNLRAKMPAAATTSCTLTVGNANAVQLWYNGAAVSADNSWEAGEIVTIFYDGTRFMASNSQGGGGQFGSGEKIKDILLSQVLGAGTDAITSQKGVSDAIFNEIDISSIDTLKTLNDALAPSSSLKPTYYTVTAMLSSVKLKVGSMAVISDNMRHVVTEIMSTHYILDDAGNLTNEHSDAEIFFIYRSVKLSGGTLPDPAGVWTKWRYVNSSVWSTVAEKIKFDNSRSGLASDNLQGALDEIFHEIVVNSTDDAQASLDISDNDGNVIARFKKGHIMTKEFDSGKTTILGGANDDNSNLDVIDEYGNVIARFENGHIRTQNFDSSISGSALPEYWKTYVDNKKDELITAELSIGFAGASFIFITDVHWKDNYKKSPAIISYIRQITQVKDVICGGDILEDHGERAAKIAEMLDWNECVKPVGCINLVGNHDYNTSDQPKSTWDVNRIKPEEFYRMCNSETEKVVSYDYTNDASVSESGYKFNAGRYTEYFGFCDNNNQKIRYIFLDSTCVHKSVRDGMTGSDLRISDAQLRWMQDRITELGEGWTALVFSHIALGADGLFEIGQQIENALDSIYDSAAATIAGVICGHCHKTLSYISTKGYPFISTTCDARKQSQAANDPTGYSNGGDVNEQAFDIYYVNTKNRTIDIIRIGAGDTDLNRNFTF